MGGAGERPEWSCKVQAPGRDAGGAKRLQRPRSLGTWGDELEPSSQQTPDHEREVIGASGGEA